MNKQLDMEQGKQIIDAINRLTQLSGTDGDSKIISLDKNAEAEKAGLREYLKNQLFEHAGFLLGCWFAVKNEYEPLCNTMASILNRASTIQALRNKENAAVSAAAEKHVPESPAPSTPVEQPAKPTGKRGKN